MMVPLKSKISHGIIILIAILLCSCAAIQTEPDFISPELNASEIDMLYVMPALDFRFNKEIQFDLDKYIRRGSKGNLRNKGYACTYLNDKSIVKGIKQENIDDLNPTLLSKLGPPQARWIMLFAFEDAYISVGYGKKATGELSAYLYDKSIGKLIWKNKRIRESGSGGLVGFMITDRAWLRDTVLFASASIVNGLPNR
jgi:hypothetical protein